jgi:DNA polymerase-3 subunit gamma/tau
VGQTTLDAILAGLEVWTATRARMRDTPHAQVLLEMAVVRLCRLGELLSVGQLTQALGQAGSVTVAASAVGAGRQAVAAPEAHAGAKKNVPPTGHEGLNGSSRVAGNAILEMTESALPELWQRLIRYLAEKSPILANHLKFANSPAIFGPNSLAIPFHHEYNHAREACSTEGNTRRIAEALAHLTGKPVNLRFDVAAGAPAAPRLAQTGQPADRKKQLGDLPLFKRAGEVLGAQIWHVDEEFNPAIPARRAETAAPGDDDDGETNPTPNHEPGET